MLIARPNIQVIREVRPTMSFTISHLHGGPINEERLKVKKLKCFEICFKATGQMALQILASISEMSTRLEVIDMHVSYKRGNIIIQILTLLQTEKVTQYVTMKGRFFYTYYSINRKKRNYSLWMANKEQINKEFDASQKLQNFVTKLSQNQFLVKNLNLN